MAKSDLADAVQAYFFEIIDAPGHSGARRDEILTEMRLALYAERPKAAEGAPKPEPPSVAPVMSEEDMAKDAEKKAKKKEDVS